MCDCANQAACSGVDYVDCLAAGGGLPFVVDKELSVGVGGWRSCHGVLGGSGGRPESKQCAYGVFSWGASLARGIVPMPLNKPLM